VSLVSRDDARRKWFQKFVLIKEKKSLRVWANFAEPALWRGIIASGHPWKDDLTDYQSRGKAT